MGLGAWLGDRYSEAIASNAFGDINERFNLSNFFVATFLGLCVTAISAVIGLMGVNE